MQQLDVQPSNPTPYTPTTGMYNTNPTPGAGGLPALSGLNNRVNPMARELQSMGRGEDKMLVHMTPDEVNSLQGLALHYGTTMTINPHTGLPEAGWLGNLFKKLIPTLLGGALAATGIGAPLAAGIVGLGSTALTGSLKKGLMAGLGAFGGASLAGAAGLGGSISKNAFGALSDKAGIFGANMGAGTVASPFLNATTGPLASGYVTAPTGAATGAATAAKTGLSGFAQRFGQTAARGLPGIVGKAAPMLAATGVLGSLSGPVSQGVSAPADQGQGTWVNEGPYMPAPRTLDPRLTGPEGRGEIQYFQQPGFGGYLTSSGELRGLPGYVVNQNPPGFAEGGSTSGVSDDIKIQFDALKNRVDAAAKAAPGSVATDFQKFMNSATDRQKIAMFTGTGTESILDNNTSGWRLKDTAKTIEDFKPTDKAADSYAYLAMTSGFTDPITGQVSGLANPATAGLKPGEMSQIGDKTFTIDENGRWKTVSDSVYRPASWVFDEGRVDWSEIGKGLTASNAGSGAGAGTGTNTAANTSTSTNTASNVSTTASNTATNTTNATLGYSPGATTSKTEGLPPGATPSGYGVYSLADKYTPSFTKVEDFVTEKVNPYTGGTEQTNKLEEYIKSYQTSPGPLTTKTLGYAPGQSPSERNRAYALELAKQQAAARQNAAAAAASQNTSTGVYYYNPANGQTYANPNFTGAVFNPVTGQFENPTVTSDQYSLARGGSIHMDDGAFVVDARTVSELGNGSSSAGQELLARLGGRPVKGPGDGVSDSIRANIGGKQEARVARDEVIIPAEAVRKLGGAKKLYALMDKAHKARKKAGRGTDTKLRMGLGAL